MFCQSRACQDLKWHFPATCLMALDQNSCVGLVLVLRWGFCRQAAGSAGRSQTRHTSVGSCSRYTPLHYAPLLSQPWLSSAFCTLIFEVATNSLTLWSSRLAHPSQIQKKWDGDWSDGERCLQYGAAGLCNSVLFLCGLLRSANLCNLLWQKARKEAIKTGTKQRQSTTALEFVAHDVGKENIRGV